ncbi:MAG: segregation/condensation protein A [Planctomycetes bacterium]|nr:segregation/condensation protein A [Planctomycetota bacterium]
MSYTVSLDNFSGPLDLLLHLIREEEVEIHDIPIATICDRYFEYLKGLEQLDVDLASEFLVMAATLMLIKSRKLLPVEEAVDLDEELDPEDELIQQLLAYKQFKLASRDLDGLALERSRIFPYAPPRQAGQEQEVELDEVDVWDLLRAFSAILAETGLDRAPRLIPNEKPLREVIDEVFRIVRAARSITFKGLFEGQKDRQEVLGRFLALLELLRRRRIRAVQAGCFADIEIVLLDERDLSDDEIEMMEAGMLAPDEQQDLLLERQDEPQPLLASEAAGASAPVREMEQQAQ